MPVAMATASRLVAFLALLSLTQQWQLAMGQTLLYDEAQLKTYARLSQQLRRHVNELSASVVSRITDLAQRKADIESQITSDISSATQLLSQMHEFAADITTNAGMFYAPTMVVAPTHPYTDGSKTQLGQVILDHGMGYIAGEGFLRFTIGGTYMMEYKMQGIDRKTLSSKVRIVGSDGSSKYTFNYYIDWEVTPFFEMFTVEVGDQLLVDTFSDSNTSWESANQVATDTFPKMWLVVRRVGSAATT